MSSCLPPPPSPPKRIYPYTHTNTNPLSAVGCYKVWMVHVVSVLHQANCDTRGKVDRCVLIHVGGLINFTQATQNRNFPLTYTARLNTRLASDIFLWTRPVTHTLCASESVKELGSQETGLPPATLHTLITQVGVWASLYGSPCSPATTGKSAVG